MKKTISVILGMAVIAIVLSSCGAENDILGQFSKRKYLKKSKATKEYELAKIEEVKSRKVYEVAEASLSQQTVVQQEEEQELMLVEEKELVEEYQVPALSKTINKDWSAYNRAFTNYPNFAINQSLEVNNSMNFNQVQRASDVVLIILCIFLPPVAVILYEDTVTGNFWLDLVLTLLFWLPGMVYAFLVCFADVSI